MNMQCRSLDYTGQKLHAFFPTLEVSFDVQLLLLKSLHLLMKGLHNFK